MVQNKLIISHSEKHSQPLCKCSYLSVKNKSMVWPTNGLDYTTLCSAPLLSNFP